jgi:hypothetical protein
VAPKLVNILGGLDQVTAGAAASVTVIVEVVANIGPIVDPDLNETENASPSAEPSATSVLVKDPIPLVTEKLPDNNKSVKSAVLIVPVTLLTV